MASGESVVSDQELPAGQLFVYRACLPSWRRRIEKLAVERISDKSVWVNGNRVARDCNDSQIFDSFDEAKAWLIARCTIRIATRERDLAEEKESLAKIASLRECDLKILTNRW